MYCLMYTKQIHYGFPYKCGVTYLHIINCMCIHKCCRNRIIKIKVLNSHICPLNYTTEDY